MNKEAITQAITWAHKKRLDLVAGTLMLAAALPGVACGGNNANAGEESRSGKAAQSVGIVEVTPTPTVLPAIIVPSTSSVDKAPELTPREKFEKNSSEYKLLVAKLPISDELAQVIQKNPTYEHIAISGSVKLPNYANLSSVEVSNQYRKYITEQWETGIRMGADPKVDFAEAITHQLYSLQSLAAWAQSPYVSNGAREQWRSAYTSGKQSIDALMDILRSQATVSPQAKAQMEDFIAKFFQRPEFFFTQEGKANPNAPIIPGLANSTR